MPREDSKIPALRELVQQSWGGVALEGRGLKAAHQISWIVVVPNGETNCYCVNGINHDNPLLFLQYCRL